MWQADSTTVRKNRVPGSAREVSIAAFFFAANGPWAGRPERGLCP